MDNTNTKFSVAVCGAGVGGLTFAIALAKHLSVSVDLYEAASEFSPTGAGIGIWPRVWDVLCRLGLGELATKASSPPTEDPVNSFTFRKSDQAEGFKVHDMITKGHLLTFHRADLHQVLVDHLPASTRIHYNKRLKTYSRQQGGGINIVFQDGSTARCDVLVGADGIKSAVRNTFLRELAYRAIGNGKLDEARTLLAAASPSWTGTVAYRAVIPAARIVKDGVLAIPDHSTQYMGKRANLIVYPISNGNLINLVAFKAKPELVDTPFPGPWVASVDQQELLAPFENWEPTVQAWLSHAEKPTRWAIHTVKPLPSFASDGVVLIGDAAHAMAPHQASGAGQAIEDAYFLATLLGHQLCAVDTIPRVLGIYDAVRRPFALDVAERSRQNGRFYTLCHDDFDYDACTGEERTRRMKEIIRTIEERWAWAWSTTVDGMMEEGVRMLESLSVV